jgi:hypothetical protein
MWLLHNSTDTETTVPAFQNSNNSLNDTLEIEAEGPQETLVTNDHVNRHGNN